MDTPGPILLTLIKAAADLRAGGASWAKVGERLNREPDTCRDWPRRYPAAWRRAYRAAEDLFTEEAGAEAKTMLRLFMRSKNEKIGLAAAHALHRARENRRAEEDRAERAARAEADPARAEALRIAEYLTRLTDAQTDAVVEELVQRTIDARARAAAPADMDAARPAGYSLKPPE